MSHRRSDAGSRDARAIDNVVTNDVGTTAWLSDSTMPFETHPDDVGWIAGPVGGDAGSVLLIAGHSYCMLTTSYQLLAAGC